MSIAAKALSVITGPLFSVIDKAVTDKDEAARLKYEIQTQLIDAENSALKAQMQVILAEAAGESWLQRNWRPILMLTIVAIVANNYTDRAVSVGNVWRRPDAAIARSVMESHDARCWGIYCWPNR